MATRPLLTSLSPSYITHSGPMGHTARPSLLFGACLGAAVTVLAVALSGPPAPAILARAPTFVRSPLRTVPSQRLLPRRSATGSGAPEGPTANSDTPPDAQEPGPLPEGAPRRPWVISFAMVCGATALGLVRQLLPAAAAPQARPTPAPVAVPVEVPAAPFTLPPLPWGRTALEPHISAETIDYHHGKHHLAYVNKLNELLALPDNAQWRGRSLEALVLGTTGVMFNQAAQIWNHTFYFDGMRPNPSSAPNAPSGPIASLISRDFGSFEAFQDKFSATAAAHFGSGWIWLVVGPDGRLQITQGHDAANPIRDGAGTPLLTCDVWEHAYYIDQRNVRPAYVKAWWNVVDWDTVNRRLPPTTAMFAVAGAKAVPTPDPIAMFTTTGIIELPPLPWPRDALAPHISAETIDYHYGKHHQAYVTKLNELLAVPENAQFKGKSLEDLVMTSNGVMFNQAAQIWNHTFYWKGLRPNPEGRPNPPTGRIASLIERDFGSVAAFQEQFTAAAAGHFGSGWIWLVYAPGGKLKITQGHDAANPVRDGTGTPLLTCDVWEHAYYIDQRNARPAYVKAWWNVVDWEFVNRCLPQ